MTHYVRVGRVSLAIAAVCWASTADAQINSGRGGPSRRQERRVGGGGFDVLTGRANGGIIGLAAMACVQKEIELEGENAEKARKIADSFDQQRRATLEKLGFGRRFFLEELGQLPADERAAKMREYRETNGALEQRLFKEFEPQFIETLTPTQTERVRQIELQAAGSRALTDAELRHSLQLTDDQVESIIRINREYEQLIIAKTARIPPNKFPARVAVIRDLNRERDDKAIEELTPDQKAKFSALKGKEFDLLGKTYPESTDE